jgi:hypothetical protein
LKQIYLKKKDVFFGTGEHLTSLKEYLEFLKNLRSFFGILRSFRNVSGISEMSGLLKNC